MYLCSFSLCFFIHTSTTQIRRSCLYDVLLCEHRGFRSPNIFFHHFFLLFVDLVVFFVCFFALSQRTTYVQVQRLLFFRWRWRSSIINTGVNTAICFVSWSILCTHLHPRSASIQVNKLVKHAHFTYFHNDKFSVDINIHTCERRACVQVRLLQ